jgi:hypothetical protein
MSPVSFHLGMLVDQLGRWGWDVTEGRALSARLLLFRVDCQLELAASGQATEGRCSFSHKFQKQRVFLTEDDSKTFSAVFPSMQSMLLRWQGICHNQVKCLYPRSVKTASESTDQELMRHGKAARELVDNDERAVFVCGLDLHPSSAQII